MKTTAIMIASSKGGVGKSTVALGIAKQIALAGESVLLCDLDFGNACLDILLGVENRVLYTVSDVAKKQCKAEDALISDGDTGVEGLMLLPCPAGGIVRIDEDDCAKGVSPSAVIDAVKSVAEISNCRYVVIDTGAGVGSMTDAAAAHADCVLVVAGHNPISLRAAEGTVSRLSEAGVRDIRLIVNSFEAEATLKKKGHRKSLLDIIDLSRAPLAGVIPYDYSLLLSHEGLGERTNESDSAFRNIACRIMGQDVPIFSGMKKIRKRRKKLYQ